MALSEEQIQRLLEWFVNFSETRKRGLEGRTRASEENRKWIQPHIIQSMSDEELERRFLEYYKGGEGRQTLNQIYRDRIIRDKNRFRKTMSYLLDENIDVRERVDQILEGKYRIEGFGKAILTGLLMDYDPTKYCVWNNKTEMGFSVIGWRVYENRDSAGTKYLKVLQALQRLRDLGARFGITFDVVDMFLHTISAEDEGREAVESIIGDREILPPEETRRIPREVESRNLPWKGTLKSLSRQISARLTLVLIFNCIKMRRILEDNTQLRLETLIYWQLIKRKGNLSLSS